MRKIRAYLATAIHLLFSRKIDCPEEAGNEIAEIAICESEGFFDTGTTDLLQRKAEKRIHKSWLRRWHDGITRRVDEELND